MALTEAKAGHRPPETPPTPAKSRRKRPGGYWLYLLPGAVLFIAVIGAPLVGTLYLSLTKWSGVGDPTFIGFDNYTRLFQDEVFWTSFKNTLAMIVAMVVVPTLLGLVLAAVLFDVIGRRFKPRTASALRAAFYLPQ